MKSEQKNMCQKRDFWLILRSRIKILKMFLCGKGIEYSQQFMYIILKPIKKDYAVPFQISPLKGKTMKNERNVENK